MGRQADKKASLKFMQWEQGLQKGLSECGYRHQAGTERRGEGVLLPTTTSDRLRSHVQVDLQPKPRAPNRRRGAGLQDTPPSSHC